MSCYSTINGNSCPNEDLDIISDLPLELKQQILTLLPIRESVQTSVLSSRWRHAWTSVSQLSFDEEEYYVTSKQFIRIVDKVLSQYKFPIFDFGISTTIFCKKALDRWINVLLEHPIEKFYVKCLESLDRQQYNVSSNLYMFHNLKEMRLINCTISLPESFKEFKQLKSLSMKCCTIKEDEWEKLVSSCVNLETLYLCNLSSMVSVNINSQKLQIFQILGDFKKIHLRAPFLVEACILSNSERIKLARFGMSDGPDYCVFHSAKRCFKIFDKPEKALPEKLNNVKSLCIMVDFGDENKSTSALSLLKNAPNLQILLLYVEGEVLSESNDIMVKFWESAKFSFEHLKFVRVSNINSGHRGFYTLLCSEPVLAFMKVVLECATQLENMLCVSTKDPFEQLQFARKLHTFKKASAKCIISIMKKT